MSNLSYRSIVFAWIVLGLHAGHAMAAEARPPSPAELEQLLEIIKRAPTEAHFVADMAVISSAWTQEQIDAEVVAQEKLLSRLRGKARNYSAQNRADRQRAIAAAHSGTRILHMEQWVAGGYLRTDLTDEGMGYKYGVGRKPAPYQETYVDLHDPKFSEFSRYSIIHPTTSAMVTRSASPHFPTTYLWQTQSMPLKLIIPVISSLCGKSGDEVIDLMKPPHTRFAKLELNFVKQPMAPDKNRSNWTISVVEEDSLDGHLLHFRFVGMGSSIDPIQRGKDSKLEADYWMSKGSPMAFVRGTLLDVASGISSSATFSGKDKYGFVSEVEFQEIIPKGQPETIKLRIRLAELNPELDKKALFYPVFPEGYSVADRTTAIAQFLPGHSPVKHGQGPAPANPAEDKRMFYVALISICTCIPILFFVHGLIKNGKRNEDE